MVDRYFMCRCGGIIEAGRVELGLKTCLKCAQRTNAPKVMGRMVYPHKTGGEIEILSAESYHENKKYFKPQGTHSCVKNFSKATR
tara:strand:- start:152 stop:406 length:255 start_codon:yes stop_codon:yes gene_type:complete